MKDSPERYNLLLLYPGPVPPSPVPARNRCYWISNFAQGRAVQRVWWRSKADAVSAYGLKGDEAVRVGAFQFTFLYDKPFFKLPLPGIKFLQYLINCVSTASKERIDVVYAYGANTTGLAAVFIKLFYRAKLILDLPGSPEKAFIFDSRKRGLSLAIKRKLADLILRICLHFADGVKLLYPTQLAYLGKKAPKGSNVFCFHDLAPASTAHVCISDEKYILFLGYPWYLKGVDILIAAFKSIENQFPQYRLEIWGHDTEEEQKYFKDLAADSDRINFGKGIDYDTAMAKLAGCSVLVLPSRTEAMGRVILEAFSLGKPVIASAVDGVPHYVRDGITGLLFKSEDQMDLAAKLSKLLRETELRESLIQNAKVEFEQRLSEENYARNFREMLDQVLKVQVGSL